MDNVTQAQEWHRFAAMDLDSAEYLLKMHPVPIEIICYHCQQSDAGRTGHAAGIKECQSNSRFCSGYVEVSGFYG